jgi:radical SAM superfamily enzyme YgiQ (UPF0313 family)
VFATFSAKECLDTLCDIVVRREAEETIVELIERLEAHADWRDVRGIAYSRDGQLVVNEDREYPRENNYTYDPSLLHGLNRGVFSSLRDFIRTREIRLNLIPISITRGCPHSCNFCYGVRMTGHRCRRKDISVALGEMKDIIEHTGCRRFMITDLNFTASPAYTKKLLRSMIENKIILQQSVAMSRIEAGKDTELLSLLAEAGVEFLFIGIEALTEDTLQLFDKRSSAVEMVGLIENFHRHGISICASFVTGADTDDVQSVRNVFDFAIDQEFWRTYVFTLGELPFQSRYYGYPQLIPDHRVIPELWKNCIGPFVGIFPKQMRPSTLQGELIRGTRRIVSSKRALRHLSRFEIGRALYQWHFRASTMPSVKGEEEYVSELEEVEEPYYDKDERLLEERLKRDFLDKRNIFAA